MSGAKHTSGPWAVNEDGWKVESEKEHGWANDGWIICKLEGSDKEANARLIAAAPDLLGAAKLFFVLEVETCNCEICEAWKTKLKAAIAKAEGRAALSPEGA